MELNPGERIDDLQINDLKLIQDPECFCFGMDAVLLSAFARAKEGDRVLDLGTGNGVIPILMSAKTDAESFTGLEIQPINVSLARRSVEYNLLQDRISIVEGDIKEAVSLFGAASFDVITTNPPYMNENHGLINDYSVKAIARHEIKCSLEDVISQAAKLLKPQGNFFMVHRPHRLVDIMELMRKYRIEPKRMRMVYPFADKDPNMVLIEGNRGGRPNLIVERPLVVYKSIGEYTDDIHEIYDRVSKE